MTHSRPRHTKPHHTAQALACNSTKASHPHPQPRGIACLTAPPVQWRGCLFHLNGLILFSSPLCLSLLSLSFLSFSVPFPLFYIIEEVSFSYSLSLSDLKPCCRPSSKPSPPPINKGEKIQSCPDRLSQQTPLSSPVPPNHDGKANPSPMSAFNPPHPQLPHHHHPLSAHSLCGALKPAPGLQRLHKRARLSKSPPQMHWETRHNIIGMGWGGFPSPLSSQHGECTRGPLFADGVGHFSNCFHVTKTPSSKCEREDYHFLSLQIRVSPPTPTGWVFTLALIPWWAFGMM